MNEPILSDEDSNIVERAKLLGSLLLFIQVFYKIRTNREFSVITPTGRESHIITICRELMKCFKLQQNRLIINVPPGLFKSTILKYFIAWCFAHYPDCQFLYISNSHSLASEHTSDIKGIMSLKEYREMFGVEISKESSAKDNFKTTMGGAVKAFGSSGAVVGQDGGLTLLDRFTGAVIMDDMHKPDDVHSDLKREKVIKTYNETILQRLRSPVVPIIFIGQRLHEDDLGAFVISGEDGYEWKKVILKGLDDAGNSIHPVIYPMEKLMIFQDKKKYVFASQIQQKPSPAGGGLFKEESFVKLEKEPEILFTFIIGDTAETDKTYNDPTVFSFFGIYRLSEAGQDINAYALHWLDCWEEWVEPKNLKTLFTDFYTACSRHRIKPQFAAIEKKSTGTALLSMLSDFRGIEIRDILRSPSESKSKRFIDCEYYVASKLISLPENGKHTKKCIEHMGQITPNETQKHDDIADTCADAIRLAIVDDVFGLKSKVIEKQTDILRLYDTHTQRLEKARSSLWQ